MTAWEVVRLVSPEVLESRRGELCVADRVLDVLVTEVVLDRTCIVPIVGQFITCGMTQHVRMDGELQARLTTGTGYYLPHGRITQRAATFADEYIGRTR